MENKEIKNSTTFIECDIVMLKKQKRDYNGKHLTLLGLVKNTLDYGESNDDFHNAAWAIQQDLYVLMDEEPQEGDYVVYKEKYIVKCNGFEDRIPYTLSDKGGEHLFLLKNNSKKIIATTNRDLNLPKVHIDFIQKYIYEYNKDTPIKKILVEVENVNNGWQSLANSGKFGSTVVPEKFELKIYNVNFINIKLKQKTWDDLAKIGTPEKWMEVYTHYQELLLENDTREFLENIPKKSWDDIYKDINTVEFNSKIEVFNYLKKHYYAPIKINQNC